MVMRVKKVVDNYFIGTNNEYTRTNETELL